MSGPLSTLPGARRIHSVYHRQRQPDLKDSESDHAVNDHHFAPPRLPFLPHLAMNCMPMISVKVKLLGAGQGGADLHTQYKLHTVAARFGLNQWSLLSMMNANLSSLSRPNCTFITTAVTFSPGDKIFPALSSISASKYCQRSYLEKSSPSSSTSS